MWIPLTGHSVIMSLNKSEPAPQHHHTVNVLDRERVEACGLVIEGWALREFGERWSTNSNCAVARYFWPRAERKMSAELLTINKVHLALVAGLLIGYCIKGMHAVRPLGPFDLLKWSPRFSLQKQVRICLITLKIRIKPNYFEPLNVLPWSWRIHQSFNIIVPGIDTANYSGYSLRH